MRNDGHPVPVSFGRLAATFWLATVLAVWLGSRATAENRNEWSDWGSETDPQAVNENLPVSAAAFRPRASDIGWARDAEGYLWATSSSQAIPFWAPVDLPSGALIERLHLLYRTEDAGQIAASLVRRSGMSAPVATILASVTAGSGTGAATHDLSASPADQRTIDNLGAQYLVEVNTPVPTASNAIRGVVIEWRRQVHPAPSFGRFTDVVPGEPLFKYVEALQAAGITGGCGPPTLYCPDQPITRGQMAVFLSIALGLHWQP